MRELPTILNKEEEMLKIGTIDSEIGISDDEDIIWEGNKNVTANFSTFSISLLIGLSATMTLLYGIFIPSVSAILFSFITILISLYILGRYYLELRSTLYVLTDEKLYEQNGYYRTSISSINLENIDNITKSQSISEKILQFGSLDIESDKNITLDSIVAYEDVYETIENKTE
jgi:uncharacterized membrane protein YdbT with pleckstrin-like domain